MGRLAIAAVREAKGNGFWAQSAVQPDSGQAHGNTPRFGGLSAGSGAVIFYQGKVMRAPTVLAATHDRTGGRINWVREQDPRAQL
jgi:hypothetical protein